MSRRPAFLAASIALLFGVGAALFWFRLGHAPELRAGILLQQPRALAPFSLIDQDGKPFGNARFAGAWTLVFAGFTHCPDVCPTTLALLKQLEAKLRDERRVLHTVFLSVDPQRDTPEQLLRYVRFFSPGLTGLTGDAAQIAQLCEGLGLAYVKVPGASDSDYSIDHSAALVLLNPRGEIAGYFQPPYKLDALTEDLRRLLPVSA